MILQAAARLLHALKVLLVALVCLLAGVAARQLIDAYGRDVLPFLSEDRKAVEARGLTAIPAHYMEETPLPEPLPGSAPSPRP